MTRCFKVLAGFLFAVSIMFFSTNVVNAEVVSTGQLGENVTYSLSDDGTMVISGSGPMYEYCDKLIQYPETWPEVFELNSVVIEEGVTTVGNSLFSWRTTLKSVKLPSTITKIDTCAFAFCSQLTDINFPDGLQIIGDSSFNNCASLTTVVLPDSVKTIERSAFYNCTALRELKLPENIETLGLYCFQQCNALSGVTIPSSVKEMAYAFFCCNGLKNVILEEGLVEIQTGTFANCSSLSYVKIPETVKFICGKSFANCKSLINVDIPAASEYIFSDAFAHDDLLVVRGHKGTRAESFASEMGIEFVDIDAVGVVPHYDMTVVGGDIVAREDGELIYILNENYVTNAFVYDGKDTYFFQADGTAMRNRLTYHPDGAHIIYFDADGHEVFSDFANVKKSIAGDAVDDYCFFDVYGYMYINVFTYDKTGTKIYYINPCGVMERNGWFTPSYPAKWVGGRSWYYPLVYYPIAYAYEDGTIATDTTIYYPGGNKFLRVCGSGAVVAVEE